MRKWSLGLVSVVFVAAVFMGGSTVSASSIWGDVSPKVISSVRNPQALSGLWRCRGIVQSVKLDAYDDPVKACVFGSLDGVRLARVTEWGENLYYVAFPTNATFFELRGLCSNQIECIYGQGADTILTHASASSGHPVIYKQFSQNIKKKYDIIQGKSYFQYESSISPLEVRVESLVPRAETFAVSQNGEWGLADLHYYGTVRINLKTGDTIRVLSGRGTATTNTELAISNDGSYLAYVGWGHGLEVFRVGNGCGDRLALDSTNTLRQGAIPCTSASIDRYALFPHFNGAYAPYFIGNGSQLSVVVYRGPDAYSSVLGYEQKGSVDQLTYLALGDSFTSGEGEVNDAYYLHGTNMGEHKCHSSSRAYPHLLANAWSMTQRSVACSGARTIDVMGGDNYMGQGDRLKTVASEALESIRDAAREKGIPGIVGQLDFVARHQPAIITVGIGGNDAGLMGKLSACLMETTCTWARDQKSRAATAQEIKQIHTALQEMYQHIKRESPRSRIIAIGYPSIINIENNATCGPVLSAVLNESERRFIDESLKYLNEVVRNAAYSEGVEYIDIEDALHGARLCENAAASGMSGIRLGDDIAPLGALPKFKVFGAESFHPTPEGHRRIAEKIRSKIPNPHSTNECNCYGDHNSFIDLQPPAYWGGVADFRQMQLRGSVPIQKLTQTQELILETLPSTFEPNTKVVASFDAFPSGVEEVIASTDGVARFSIATKNTPPGFYTAKMTGRDFTTGAELETYQVVQVEGRENVADVEVLIGRGALTTPSESISSITRASVPKNRPAYVGRTNAAVFGDTIVKPNGQQRSDEDTKPAPISALNQVGTSPYFVVAGLLTAVGVVLVVYLYIRLCRNR